jgi:hypothetical protein
MHPSGVHVRSGSLGQVGVASEYHVGGVDGCPEPESTPPALFPFASMTVPAKKGVVEIVDESIRGPP